MPSYLNMRYRFVSSSLFAIDTLDEAKALIYQRLTGYLPIAC